MKNLVICILIPFLFFGCSFYNHEVQVNPKLEKKNLNLKKIVLIEPDFFFKDFRQKNSVKYLKSDEMEAKFISSIVKSAKKNNVEVDLYDKSSLNENDVFYYNDLLPLKNDILSNMILLEADKKRKTDGNGFGKVRKKYQEKSPIIDPKYSVLSDKLETEYFAISGMVTSISKKQVFWGTFYIVPAFLATFQPVKESFYYFTVVNVNTGEVVYQEFRLHNERFRETTMQLYLYDTFKILKTI